MAHIVLEKTAARCLTKISSTCAIFERFYCSDKSENLKDRLQQYVNNANDLKLFQWGIEVPDLQSSKGVRGRQYYRSSFSQNPSRFSFEEKNLPCFLFRHVFKEGYSVLSSYISQDAKSLRTRPASTRPALEALRNFARTKNVHEKHLKAGRGHHTETDMVYVMILHLLTQLLPKPDNYLVEYATGKNPNECPCGCGQTLQYGVTSVGNKEFFYGRPDVMLFANKDSVCQPDGETSTAFTIQKTQYSELDREYEQTENDVSYKVSENEYILVNEAEHGSFKEDGLTQLLKSAIAMSFCYRKRLLLGKESKQEEMKNSVMIPCCGISSTGYTVALYDSSNDVLLCSGHQSFFTDNDRTLNFSSVFNLWMIINHNLFCNGLSKTAIEKFKGSCLRFDEDEMSAIVKDSNWFFDIDKDNFHEKRQKYVEPEIFPME